MKAKRDSYPHTAKMTISGSEGIASKDAAEVFESQSGKAQLDALKNFPLGKFALKIDETSEST